MLLFVAFLIPLIHNRVSANEVKSYAEQKISNQLYMPWHSSAIIKFNNNDFEIGPKGQEYSARCEVYDKQVPLTRLFTHDGILIETAEMRRISDESLICDDSKIGNSIFIEAENGGKTKIIYMFYVSGSIGLQCVERTYTIERGLLTAQVEKSAYGMVQCPSTMQNYMNQNTNDPKAGGIVKLTEAGKLEVGYKLTSDEVHVIGFPVKDLKGMTFSMICGDHDDPRASDTKVNIGVVRHVDYEGIAMDVFEMKTCSIDHINVNRRIENKKEHFKMVYKKVDGTCQEREYIYTGEQSFNYYNRLTVERSDPQTVHCPSSFKGDIGLNAHAPWYMRILRIVLFFLFKAEPYGVEI